MKNAVLVVLCFMLSTFSAGQDFTRAEIFGGYSYLNADANGLISRQSLNGWEASLSVNANKWLAAEADFSGYYKNYTVDLEPILPGAGTVKISVHDYSFAGGPRVNFKPVFIHALFGVDRLTGSALGFSASQNSFAGAVGGGLQWTVAQQWSIRASSDYIFTRHNIFGGDRVTQNNVRASVGFVYSFGGTASDGRKPRPASAKVPPSAIAVPALGIRAVTPDNGGAEIVEVASGSVVALAGLRVGDVINTVDGKPTTTAPELAAALSNRAPGEKVRLGFLVRNQWQSETLVTLVANQ
jgi:opacity protein-like surface antigen